MARASVTPARAGMDVLVRVLAFRTKAKQGVLRATETTATGGVAKIPPSGLDSFDGGRGPPSVLCARTRTLTRTSLESRDDTYCRRATFDVPANTHSYDYAGYVRVSTGTHSPAWVAGIRAGTTWKNLRSVARRSRYSAPVQARVHTCFFRLLPSRSKRTMGMQIPHKDGGSGHCLVGRLRAEAGHGPWPD